MELVDGDAERDQGIGIEEVRHGSSSSNRATRSLVTVGAFAPGFRTGSPVRALVESRDDGRRSRLGVSTTRSWSISTRSESPATRPSFRRTGLGRTICPLLDKRVSTVRHLTFCPPARRAASRRSSRRAAARDCEEADPDAPRELRKFAVDWVASIAPTPGPWGQLWGQHARRGDPDKWRISGLALQCDFPPPPLLSAPLLAVRLVWPRAPLLARRRAGTSACSGARSPRRRLHAACDRRASR